MISSSGSEMSLVKIVHRHAFFLKFNLIINNYFTYINDFTLVHLSVFELASIYLTLVCSHWRKAQECQKIMCFNLC